MSGSDLLRQTLTLAFVCLGLESASAEEISFNRDVRPILSDRCFQCHGPDAKNQASEFRLDSAENALADLGGYAGIVPGDLTASELHLRIRSTDENRMPPVESKLELTEAEKDTLDAWILAGAPFDKHWSFKPIPTRTNVPTAGRDWAGNEIDRFVAKQLQAADHKHSAQADRSEIIRRLTFDLTGLPPTLAEIDAFEQDQSSQAYEKLVDRLLASPRFGERMAVDWLDLARYADTYGYQEDRYRDMWQWRDWVIKAFNQNMPFDQFVTWQLAGDLLPNATDEQILATAFNRLHRQTSEGGSIEAEFRNEYVVDRVDTFGAAFLGLTVGCARCHDHKYDPLSQKEYYQFSAFFNNIDESGIYPFFTSSIPTPTLDLATEAQRKELVTLRQQVDAAELALEEVRHKHRDAFRCWLDAGPGEVSISGKIGHFSWDNLPADLEPDAEVRNQVDPESSGKLVGLPKVVGSKTGMALQLDGENGFSTTVGGEFRRYDPFTIGLWIKTPRAYDHAVLWHRTRAGLDAGSRGYELLIEDGHLAASIVHFWPGNAIKIRNDHPLPVDRWVQVTVTYDGSNSAEGLHIYLDGRLQAAEVVRDCLTRRIDYGCEENIVDQSDVAKLAHRLAIGHRFRDRGFLDGLVDELVIFDRQLTDYEVASLVDHEAALRQLLADTQGMTIQQEQQLYLYYLHNHDEQHGSKLKDVKSARQAYAAAYDEVNQIMVMQEMPQRRPTFLLARGAYDAPSEQVFAQTPDWLPPMDDAWPDNRLGLARWLTDPNHPLTARVTVNRFWQTFFGNGLVATPLDFGSQGALPTHPDLLDWLAREFIDSGWDVKQLIKTIVMSSTYRQTAACDPTVREQDPENRLLTRGPQQRLPAEMLRDSALSASGLLVEKIGGPPVKPYQPAGLWIETGWVKFERDPGEGSHRRSLYTYWKRTSPQPSMMTLDAPDREVCVARRQSTSTPLQPLVLLNDPQYVETARAFAESALRESNLDISAQIRQGFRRATSRQPTSAELASLRNLFDDQLQLFQAQLEHASAFLAVGDHQSDKALDSAQLAALTVTFEAIMNLNEAVTK